MDENAINELISSLKSKLDLAISRLNEMERRLSNLERKVCGDTTNPQSVREPVIATSHSYLKRIIKSALDRYQSG